MLRTSKISFPGFGIGEFEIDSTAISIGNFEIAWYAVIITIGMIFAVLHLIFRANQVGINVDTVIDFVLFTIPIGIIGARVYYVIAEFERFDSFAEMINIRSGGLAIYGGIIAGAITVYTISKIKKIPFLVFADCCTPGILLAQAIGRWGNFTNGEAFGCETDWFCRMGLMNSLTGYQTLYVHPTFLYESLWNLIGFIIANIFHKKRQYDGQVFLFIFGWYGFGRMFIEGLRADSLYASIFGLEFRISQVLAALIFSLCLAALIYFSIKKPNKKLYFHTHKEFAKKEK
jgi:phosphatidylglycerol:prolipoprotein diacylglycerol transferase